MKHLIFCLTLNAHPVIEKRFVNFGEVFGFVNKGMRFAHKVANSGFNIANNGLNLVNKVANNGFNIANNVANHGLNIANNAANKGLNIANGVLNIPTSSGRTTRKPTRTTNRRKTVIRSRKNGYPVQSRRKGKSVPPRRVQQRRTQNAKGLDELVAFSSNLVRKTLKLASEAVKNRKIKNMAAMKQTNSYGVTNLVKKVITKGGDLALNTLTKKSLSLLNSLKLAVRKGNRNEATSLVRLIEQVSSNVMKLGNSALQTSNKIISSII